MIRAGKRLKGKIAGKKMEKEIQYRKGTIKDLDLICGMIQKAIAEMNHKAICQGYTAVFDILCRQCELKSFIVHGYVKQNGQLLESPHAWNAVLINGKWQLFL